MACDQAAEQGWQARDNRPTATNSGSARWVAPQPAWESKLSKGKGLQFCSFRETKMLSGMPQRTKKQAVFAVQPCGSGCASCKRPA